MLKSTNGLSLSPAGATLVWVLPAKILSNVKRYLIYGDIGMVQGTQKHWLRWLGHVVRGRGKHVSFKIPGEIGMGCTCGVCRVMGGKGF